MPHIWMRLAANDTVYRYMGNKLAKLHKYRYMANEVSIQDMLHYMWHILNANLICWISVYSMFRQVVGKLQGEWGENNKQNSKW